jgi:hypothetical protein
MRRRNPPGDFRSPSHRTTVQSTPHPRSRPPFPEARPLKPAQHCRAMYRQEGSTRQCQVTDIRFRVHPIAPDSSPKTVAQFSALSLERAAPEVKPKFAIAANPGGSLLLAAAVSS